MMLAVLDFLTLLAQAEGAGGGGGGGGEAGNQGSPLGMFVPLIAVGIFFYFIMMRPQMKERRQHQQMLDNLQKHDKVMTVGGIVGTVANVSQDGNEITVRVDDNTRLKFMRNYIHSVVVDSKDEST